MKIYSVTVKGFRCFGSVPTVIKLSDGITALVGAKGSGKTALLEALLRVFGVTSKQRTVVQTDFHVPPGTSDDDRSSRERSQVLRDRTSHFSVGAIIFP
jgi:putative ATP-dependent endonuclease of OLD family